MTFSNIILKFSFFKMKILILVLIRLPQIKLINHVMNETKNSGILTFFEYSKMYTTLPHICMIYSGIIYILS